MIGRLTGATQAEEIFQALAWSWGVPSIIPAGDLHKQKYGQQKSDIQHWSVCEMYLLTGNHLLDFH